MKVAPNHNAKRVRKTRFGLRLRSVLRRVNGVRGCIAHPLTGYICDGFAPFSGVFAGSGAGPLCRFSPVWQGIKSRIVKGCFILFYFLDCQLIWDK